MRLVVLGVLASVVVAGCKSRSPEPTPGPAASVSPAASVATAPVASTDPSGQRRVTDADCDRWADHGADVVVGNFVEVSRACPKKVQDDVGAKFLAQKASLRDGAKALCAQHINQSYKVQDGACFLAATTARDLAACKLAPMTNPGDSDWPQMIDDLRKQCGVRIAPSSAAPAPAAPGSTL